MCWSCNPYCGGCKPPKPKPIKCPNCHIYCFPEFTSCQRCGTPLPEPAQPVAAFCLHIGAVCAAPCNKHKKAPLEGQTDSCPWHTPPPEGE
jgi:hypothetical protein